MLRDNTTRFFSPPDFYPILGTLGGIGIAAQLYLLYDSQFFPELGARTSSCECYYSGFRRGESPKAPLAWEAMGEIRAFLRTKRKRC
jgi:hypothetical protein